MKLYAYLAAFVVAVGLIWGVYHAGGAGCRADSAQSARTALETQNKLALELQKANKSREVRYRDKIKIVDKVVDSCADTLIPPDVLLLLPGGGKTQ